jgi:hypothetical protein
VVAGDVLTRTADPDVPTTPAAASEAAGTLATGGPEDGPVYRLAEGTELVGRYQDSAFEVPKFLVHRADGQVMQLPELLYRVAGSLDGRSAGQVAAALSAELGQELTGLNPTSPGCSDM